MSRTFRVRDVAVVLLAVLLTGCTDGATSPQEARHLANTAAARNARSAAESQERAIVRAYAGTKLKLALVTVQDHCAPGAARQWFESDGADLYKVRCSLRVVAYFGARPQELGDVLDSVFTAGDRRAVNGTPSSTIPFIHYAFTTRLVAYYKGRGPNPIGTEEPTEVSGASQTLSWDSIRRTPRLLIDEPDACLPNDPRLARCLREPSSMSVADVRRSYGIVLKLTLPYDDYYTVYKHRCEC